MSKQVDFRKNLEIKKLFGPIGERAESPAHVNADILRGLLDDDKEYLDRQTNEKKIHRQQVTGVRQASDNM